jgi:beta-lactam-binding protein with PASTA domain
MARYELKDATDLSAIAKSMERIDAGDGTDKGAAKGAAPKAAPIAAGKAILLGVGIGILVMAGVIFGIKYIKITPPMHTVPSGLMGQPVSAAQALVNQKKLRPIIIHDSSSKGKAGTVVKVKPPEGARVKANSDVTLVVAGKPKTAPQPPPTGNQHTSTPDPRPVPPSPAATKITLPDVVEMSEAKARQKLAALGLDVEVKPGEPAAQAGTVQAMKPKPESAVEKGAVVVLTVSTKETAPAPLPATDTLITLKDYTGTLGTDAVKDLRKAGIVVAWSYEKTRIQPAGYVVKTIPPASSQLLAGSQVMLVLAKQ